MHRSGRFSGMWKYINCMATAAPVRPEASSISIPYQGKPAIRENKREKAHLRMETQTQTGLKMVINAENSQQS